MTTKLRLTATLTYATISLAQWPAGHYSLQEINFDQNDVDQVTNMRVTWTGIGFHDATWQEAFGGERYRTAGSHGCINMSLSDAGRLYEMLEMHTPVVIHY